MYIPSLSLCPRLLASLRNLVQHSTMWYRPWKFNPHLVANKITQQKWFQIVLGWMYGGALWLFLHLLFFGIAFSLSPLLCAACDVALGDNKWLDVFRCHVKPGEGHVLNCNCWGGLGLRGLGLGCTRSASRHQAPAEWAPCQVSVTQRWNILVLLVPWPEPGS